MSYVYPSETYIPSSDIGRLNPSFDMKTDFLDALTNGDISQASSVFAEDGVFLFPGIRAIKGRSLVHRMLSVIRRRYEHIEWKASVPMVCSGGWLVTGWSVHGTFKQTGLVYDNEVLSLVKLNKDGKIALLSDYFKDTLAFQTSLPEPKVQANSLSVA